jgi:hypothetical protein
MFTPIYLQLADVRFSVNVKLLFTIPHFPMIVGVLARILFSWIPFTILQRLVILVTGHPFSASATTTAFLKTPGGVRQALYVLILNPFRLFFLFLFLSILSVGASRY